MRASDAEMSRCAGKVRHASAALAYAVAKKVKASGKSGALSSYRCQFCGGWHLGRKPKWSPPKSPARPLSKGTEQ